MISFTFNIRKFVKFKSKRDRDMRRVMPIALNAAGDKIKSLILGRTAQGNGLKGKFPRYSKGYEVFRRKNGKGLTPNLKFTGGMLKDLDVKKVNTNRVLVLFKTKESGKKAAWVSAKRPFMGVKPDEKKLVTAAFLDEFRRKL